jgi:hypothetical protein
VYKDLDTNDSAAPIHSITSSARASRVGDALVGGASLTKRKKYAVALQTDSLPNLTRGSSMQ